MTLDTRAPMDARPKTTFRDMILAQEKAARKLVEQAQTISYLTKTPVDESIEDLARILDSARMTLELLAEDWATHRKIIFSRRRG